MVDQPHDVVVVGVDGSDKDARAVEWAADEAVGQGTGLHILYSFPILPDGFPAVQLEELGTEITGRARQRALARQPELEVTTQTVVSDPATALVRASATARVLVVGARGLGRIAGRLLGSVSQKVAAHGQGVIVVVRDAAAIPEGPVVAGVDPAEVTPGMLEFAFAQAARRRVPVRLVHAEVPRPAGLEDPRVDRLLAGISEQESAQLTRLAQEWRARRPDVPVETKEVHDHPVEALTEESADACLLVVGSRGRRGLSGLRLGSVARGVLHESPVVAIVHLAPEQSGDTEA